MDIDPQVAARPAFRINLSDYDSMSFLDFLTCPLVLGYSYYSNIIDCYHLESVLFLSPILKIHVILNNHIEYDYIKSLYPPISGTSLQKLKDYSNDHKDH